MKLFGKAMFAASLLAASPVLSQAFLDQELSESDLEQFFGLIEDGKISKDKMSDRCADQQVAFTFLGRDVPHDGGPKRVLYNVSRQDTSVDGRTLRAKLFNASFGEWTGSVFKAMCPGIYSISIDFATDDVENAADDVFVHLHVRRAEEDRPGPAVVSAVKLGPGNRGNGHATLAIPLHMGDEVSTWSEGKGSGTARHFHQITLTAHKFAHVEDYVEELDMDAWNDDIAALAAMQ